VTGIVDREVETAVPGRAPNAVRLAVFTSHPIQYQAPLFRALAKADGLQPTVFFGSRHGLDVSLDAGFGQAFQWDVPLLDGYQHAFLPNTAQRPDVSRFNGVRLTRPESVLREGRFDVLLLLGWQTLAHIQMLNAAWNAGIPTIVRGESTLQREPAVGMQGLMRRILWLPMRQRLYRAAFERVAAFLVIGSRNRDYYRSFGVQDEKLYWAPYGVDNDWFSLPDAERVAARARIRHRLGVGAATILFASSAKLIPRKRPLDLVDAIAVLRRTGVDARAMFLGDGEERAAIQERAARVGIANATTIVGFVNQRELPEWYAAADCLVLPSDSRETWGLVVNEAMAAGLPVVVSDAAGCSVDLVRDGENGFTYPCGDVEALAERLHRIASMGDRGRGEFGERSREIVKGFGIDVAVRATEAAVAATRSRGVHA
jgi:glycosyltransferase involved in cell wall biosynthesis